MSRELQIALGLVLAGLVVRVLWTGAKAWVAGKRAEAAETPSKADDARWAAADEALGDEPPEVK